ncbi:MarR family transcriptional regulator [Dysgonomonas sp.]|nr:MarR family winged helix-turn-helix transcriptional regulator [Prevotella sp.]
MEGICSKSTEPNDSVSFLIWRIMKHWQRGKQRLLDEFGITGSQMELLGAICYMSEHKIEATQIILSQETEIDPMTTSTILRNLQKKGLISRRESTTDTRARIVEVTDEGVALFCRAKAKIEERQEELFKNIDKQGLVQHLQLLLREMDRLNKSNN